MTLLKQTLQVGCQHHEVEKTARNGAPVKMNGHVHPGFRGSTTRKTGREAHCSAQASDLRIGRSAARVETRDFPRAGFELGSNQVHGFRVQLANTGFSDPEHFADFAQATFFLVMESKHQAQPLG